MKPRKFLAHSAVTLAAFALSASTAYAARGSSYRQLIFSVFAVLPVTLGLLFGQCVRAYISEAKFKYLIIGILIISGISMLWRASSVAPIWPRIAIRTPQRETWILG